MVQFFMPHSVYDKIWGGGTICISVPPLQILEGLVPPVSP